MAVTLNEDRLQAGYNTLNPFVLVKGPGGAAGFIGFLREVFDGVERDSVRTPDRDGSILHAEVRLGGSSVLLADSKPDWPFTPAFEQIYVDDLSTVLERAASAGAEIVTPRSAFYGGFNIARILDPWGNLWWIYEPDAGTDDRAASASADTSWQDRDPSAVYMTLMDVMVRLRPSAGAQ